MIKPEPEWRPFDPIALPKLDLVCICTEYSDCTGTIWQKQCAAEGCEACKVAESINPINPTAR